jgi:hypothetical protein
MNIRTMVIRAAAATFLAVSGLVPGVVTAQSTTHTFFAVLLGGNEVSAAGQADAGDPDGRGSATITIPNATTLCFAILVTGIDAPVAAHVHRQVAGRNGPILIPLARPAAGNPGNSSGCVANLDPTLLNAITQTPWAFYVNVHTGLFPEGALRGQLF